MEGPLLSLPLKQTYRRKHRKPSEDRLQKKIEDARKRREILFQKNEEKKSETVKNLLSAKSTKLKKRGRRPKKRRGSLALMKETSSCPAKISILHKSHIVRSGNEKDSESAKAQIIVSVPKGIDFDQFWSKTTGSKPSPSFIECENKACKRRKRYRCSKNGRAVCGRMECYKLIVDLQPVTKILP
mmetsp:Transcript_31541/g.76967  ORF Transcript_31541/g.76967 Transcript_31541/m.76967 type:complete len:185 (-) Transcript_31541:233-787(-)